MSHTGFEQVVNDLGIHSKPGQNWFNITRCYYYNIFSGKGPFLINKDTKTAVCQLKKQQQQLQITRLRAVPLSLSPSCVTLKKTARKKWPREILEARSVRNEGLPPKPKSLNYCMRCSHNAKIWLAHVSSLDNVLSTFKIRLMSCRNVLEPEQIEAVPEQIEESHFTSRDVLANVATGFEKI